MRRLLLLAGLGLMMVAGPAAAQSTSEAADGLDLRGYYVAPGADVPINAMEDLARRFPGIGFVALDDPPSEGADGMADDLLNRVSAVDTVIVLTADDAGAASATYDGDQLDRAFDRAFAESGDDYLSDFEQVASALSSTGPATTTVQTGTGSGGPSFGWLLVAAIVVVVGFFLWRSSRVDEKAVSRRLEEARTEIRSQMAAVANQILAFSDRVDTEGHPEAVEHFRRGSDVYQEAERRLATASTWKDLESLSDDLDEARWELAAAEAQARGEDPPPHPEDARPEPCFFDPTHGAGTEVAELQTPAGTRNVLVCKEDAAKLRRGERPEPRPIGVGGEDVPAAQAPRSHGGQGFDWLDAFSILVGGMANPMPYRWGRPRRYVRRTGGFGFPGGLGGGFGGGGLGGGSRTRGTSSAGRSRSIGRSRRSR